MLIVKNDFWIGTLNTYEYDGWNLRNQKIQFGDQMNHPVFGTKSFHPRWIDCVLDNLLLLTITHLSRNVPSI